MSPWQHLDAFPPAAVRLLARQRARGRAVEALSDEEVAISAGLPLARVQEIARMKDWTAVTVGEMRAFCRGCAFDPLDTSDRHRAYAYLRTGRRFLFLKRSRHYATRVQPLVQSLAAG